MKEKIGIEKLIELLNECRAEHDVYPVVYDEKDLDSLWILKRFVKWLVENDKIDRDKCGFKNEGLSGNWYDSGIAFVQNYDNDTYKVSEFYSPYLQLLMLLSISDTPIEDLLLYLK